MSDEVRASHLLVKHQGSRRPASWRDPDGQFIPKRTKDAALEELLAYKEQIDSGVVAFADLAAKVSDCSSAKHGEIGRAHVRTPVTSLSRMPSSA